MSFLVLVLLILTITATAQEYTENGAMITKSGKYLLNDPNPMTIEIKKYSECHGNVYICYKSANGMSDVLGKCPEKFCLLNVDVGTKSSNWGRGMIRGSSLIFTSNYQDACKQDTENGLHTYDIVGLPQNCEIVVIGATEPKTTTKSTALTTTQTSETTTKVEKASANTTIIIVCGVLLFLLYVFAKKRLAGYGISGFSVLLILFAILFFTVIKPRWAASRTRRQPIVAAEAGENRAPLLPKQTPSTTKKSKTPLATPVKIAKKAKAPPKATKARESIEAPTSENKTLQQEETTTQEQPEAPTAPVQHTPSAGGMNEDRTQDSPTGTEGTPPVKHLEANAMKKKSIFKAWHYVPKTQTNVPYRRKRKLDSLEQLVPIAESVLATLERNARVSKTIQMTIASQWRLDVDHGLSKLEKSVLRDVSEVALDSLAELIVELDNDLNALHADYNKNDSSPIAWEFVNRPETPASAGFRLFVMSYPVVLDDVKESLADPLITAMSVPGLYLLLMSSHFKPEFKAKLLNEMRERAKQLFEVVPTNNVASSAFPIPYLSRRHAKDKNNFVKGVSKKSQEKK